MATTNPFKGPSANPFKGPLRARGAGLRELADRRTLPQPARRDPARAAALQDRLVSFDEQAAAGMSDIEAGARNFMPQAELFARDPERGLVDVGEGVIDAGARFGAELLDRPAETLLYPLTAPYRAGRGYMETMNEVAAGRPLHAVDRGIETATAIGETGLLATPVRGGRTPPARGTMARAVDDFDRSNVEPFAAGVAAETPASGFYGPVTKVTAENVVAGIPARGQLQARLGQAEAQAGRLAEGFSPARTAAETGDAIRSGVTDFARRKFPAEAESRYAAVRAQLNPGSAVSTQAARATIEAVNNRFSNTQLSELFRNSKLGRLQVLLEDRAKPGALSGTALHFDDLAQLRSEVRRMRAEPGLRKLRAKIGDANLARLEGALTEDLYEGAASAVRARRQRGQVGPAETEALVDRALADLQQTNAWYRETARLIAEDLQPLMAKSAEATYGRVASAARGGAQGDIRRLRSLMESLDPATRRDIAATVLRDLSAGGKGGGFTPTTWASAWERLSPDAKELLFAGPGGEAALSNLEAFYRVTRKMREFERYGNFSNSARAGQTLASLGAFAAAPVTAALLHAAWAAGGRLLMSPSFTRVLARVAEASARGADAASLYAKQYSIVTALEEIEPQYAADYRRMLEMLPPPETRRALPAPAAAERLRALPPPP
jgi:hypothetical protein